MVFGVACMVLIMEGNRLQECKCNVGIVVGILLYVRRQFFWARGNRRVQQEAKLNTGEEVMLKGIHPALNGDVLKALCAMGHGDVLVLVDSNFPSDSVARQTQLGKPLTMENITATSAMTAILSVFPLDTPLQPSVGRMEVIGDPDEMPPIQQEAQAIIDINEGQSAPMYSIERMAFYEKAKQAYCVIATGEDRFYGCFLMTKGVIPAADLKG